MAFGRVIPLQNSNPQYVNCALIAPNGSQADSDFENLAANTSAPLTLQGPITTNVSGAIRVQCYEVAAPA
jgi:hypothetical protein